MSLTDLGFPLFFFHLIRPNDNEDDDDDDYDYDDYDYDADDNSYQKWHESLPAWIGRINN